MDLAALTQQAKEIKALYAARNEKQWSAAEYLQGFVGDVGNLSKLLMAHNGYRQIEGVDEKIKHELADCLWSVLILADELKIDLEGEFSKLVQDFKNKIPSQA